MATSKSQPAAASASAASAASPLHARSSSMSSVSTASSDSSHSSHSSRSRNTLNLSLDLSNLPPPALPHSTATAPAAPAAAPTPTNTLLFTGLDHPDIFRPDNLAALRALVEQSARLHAWAPLRSFRRIVVSFFSAQDAAVVRAVWDGEAVLGSVCHVYYGRATPIGDGGSASSSSSVAHLALPDAGKLFFISPPPSPPHDWEMRREGAPNKQVHADDLAAALAKLHHHSPGSGGYDETMDVDDDGNAAATTATATAQMSSPAAVSAAAPAHKRGRSRSSTLVIYQPQDHGSHPNLPAIAVEDLTVDDDDNDNDNDSPMQADAASSQPIMAHTTRPPVELMQDA